MIIWNILNPSDPITLLGDDYATVTAATMLLSNGHYGADECFPVGKKREVPFFGFWEVDGIDKWFTDAFPEMELPTKGAMEAFVSRVDKRGLARVLRTVQVCGPDERRSYQKALEAIEDGAKKQEYARWFKEERRTSMNDIAKVAWHLADQLEEHAAREERDRMGMQTSLNSA